MTQPLIVLIEDNSADVLLFKKALAEAGVAHTLVRFETGNDALEPLCGRGATLSPDAILMDLNTPRSDGFDVLKTLKSTPRLSSVPIAVMSSSRAASDHKLAALHGTPFIQKPSQLEDFLTEIGNAVREILRVVLFPSRLSK